MLYCVFCIELSLHLPSFIARGLQMTINFALVLTNISSRHSNLNFAHHFVIYWLFQNGAKKNQHLESHQIETIHDKFVICAKLRRQKSLKDEQNTCMNLSEISAEGIFVPFSWWLLNVKSRSKWPFFFKWAPFWNLISQKKKQTNKYFHF